MTTTSNETWTTTTTNHFPQGTEVEVSSDEEGFKGAWFRATVISAESVLSSSSKRRRSLVEYRNLVTEDGSEPLRELVDLAHVRPLPPAVGCLSFEVGDVVDADYRDGWWTGVVKKPLGNSKFRVFFDNPPDLIEFHQNQMRIHQDWLNGHWVRPKREPQMTGSHFSPGTDVEVNIEIEDSTHVWIPSIVVKENKDNTFLVKFHNPKPKHWGHTVDFLHIRPPAPRYADRAYKLHERVEVFHDSAWRAAEITKILFGKAYVVSLKTGFNFKSKEVSRTELRPRVEWKGGKWEIESKESLATSNSKVKEDIEPAPKKIKTAETATQLESQCAIDEKLEKKTPHLANLGKNLMEQSLDQEPEADTSPLSNSNTSERTLATPTNGVGRGRHSKNLQDGAPADSSFPDTTRIRRRKLRTSAAPQFKTLPRRTRKPVVPFKFENFTRSKRKNNGAVEAQQRAPVKRIGRPRKSQVRTTAAPPVGQTQNASTDANKRARTAELPSRVTLSTIDLSGLPEKDSSSFLNKELQTLTVDPRKDSDELEEDDSTELSQPGSGVSIGNKRKRGRPRKLMISDLEASDGVDPQNETELAQEVVQKISLANEVALPIQGRVGETTDLLEVYRRKRTDVSPIKGITNETGTVSGRQGNGVNEDDQPLSMWFNAMQTQPGSESKSLAKTVDLQNGNKEQAADTATSTSTVNTSDEGLPKESHRLPFTKTSPIWKVIESMEIFRVMPQNPHFRPLYKCKEECREGLAIGNLVTFSGLVDKISKLRFEDRGSVYSSILDSLLDLEKQGFNVQALRDRMNELISIRDKLEPIQKEAKEIQTDISKHTDDKIKLDEEIEDVERKMSELKEKREYISVQLELKNLELERLQKNLDVTCNGVGNLRREFNKLRAAPYRLT